MFCDRMGTKQTRGELLLGEYMGTKEAAKKWGVTQDLVARWCRAGKIDGAEQDAKGSPWRLPADATKPGTARRKQTTEKENKKK